MKPFLKSIAKGYVSRYNDLSETCFVFPNKRSGTFFLKYLREECRLHPRVSPEIMTITDFVAMLSGKVVASRLDMLFMLYESYREIKGMPADADGDTMAEEFDSFRAWGETVLSDFSEVDQYMVPQEEIFKNVMDFRKISSNFLTDEQRQIMTEYFGHTDYGNPSKFWKNFDDDEDMSGIKGRFFRLWQMLSPLYQRFTEKLEAKGLSTSGGNYRLAVEQLREKGRGIIPYRKVVMVGFNALSAAEHALFSALRDAEGYEGYDSFGDFFWDATGPILSASENSASRFVRANIRRFPAPEWAIPFLQESDSREMPRLRVVSSPSRVAQAKIAGNLLAEQRSRLSESEISDAKVAVVLPDEGLLLPMLYSLPEGMGDVNLTMGYSLRLTSVASFVSILRMIGGRVRKSGDMPAFYHRDLRLFLGHPFSLSMLGDETIGKIISFLDRHHKAVITLEELKTFSTVAASMLDLGKLDTDPATTLNYVRKILSDVISAIEKDERSATNTRLEIDHINVYIDSINRLEDILGSYNIRMRPAAVMRLMDRLLSGEKVGFEGEPLTGLQVMGTLETRSVDFDYVTILSMNERIMPRKSRARSFIPDTLRRAYGMPPSTYSESIFAYYFFRMVSRAKEVTMIYDARTGAGAGGGDVSRYILQLRHLYAKGMIESQDWKFRLSGKNRSDASIDKTPDVKMLLEEFSKEGGKNFSVSSLQAYRECEVKFFYKSVMGIDTDPAPTEFINAITFGNIVHNVMLNLYVPEKYHNRFIKTPIVVDKEMLKTWLSDTTLLTLLIRKAINKEHFNLPTEELGRPLQGGAKIISDQVLRQVRGIIRHDMKLAPFRILGGEIKETLHIPLRSGRTVNFRFAIDRLDEVVCEDGKARRRIIDYKTGSLKQNSEDWHGVFHGDYKSEQLFQLMSYAWLLGRSSGADGNDDVRMEIYHLHGIMNKRRSELPKIGDESVASFKPYSDEFAKDMDQMIQDIFDKDVFEAAPDENRCLNCELRTLCGR